MDPIYINSMIAALGYAVAALLSKHALAVGVGVLRLSFLINWIFVPVFACVLLRHEGAVPWSLLFYPVATGGVFFVGQLFTFAAIRLGDVSLQTPVMGSKTVFVVLIAALFGVQEISISVVCAAVFSMLAVALLGFSGGAAGRIWLTLCLALLSAFFFAGSDIMVSHYGASFGVPAFLFIAMVVNALLSLLLIPFFHAPLRAVSSTALIWGMLAGLVMALQALLLNYSLARYGDVAAANIFYSTRGLWSILIGLLALRMTSKSASPLGRRLIYMRLGGALLMSVSIAILFI